MLNVKKIYFWKKNPNIIFLERILIAHLINFLPASCKNHNIKNIEVHTTKKHVFSAKKDNQVNKRIYSFMIPHFSWSVHNKCLAVFQEWLNIVYFVPLIFSCDQGFNKYIHQFLLLTVQKLHKISRNNVEYQWWSHKFTRRFMWRRIREEDS